MTSRGSRGSDKPPPPELPELHDDPLQYPASDAGWDDERPRPPPASTATPRHSPATATARAPATAPAPTTATSSESAAAVEVAPPAIATPTVEPAALPRDRASVDAAPSSRSPSFPALRAPEVASASAGGAGEESLLPATYDDNDLRSAVGASPISGPATAAPRKQRAPVIDRRHDDDDEPLRPPRNRKTIVVSAFSIVAGLAIAGLVFLGYANSDRYLLACEAERAVPEQGRTFPPWGTHAVPGEPWKPLKIAPETRCQPHETDDLLALERLYLAMILDQATGLLTAREVTKIDDAEALLKQALLLTRPPEHESEKLANERNEHHTEIERMLGDVTYWRASARLHDARAALMDAAKQFDSAAAQHPRHVLDAAAWATYARKLAEELHTGPAGAPPSTASPAAPAASAVSPVVPALPVEPGKSGADEPPPAPAPPDAGVPTGGVLL